MENNFSHWKFTWEDDYPLAIEWSMNRKRARKICEAWLSNSGSVIALNEEPVMMFWLYFDPSCTLAFLDSVMTRPGVPFHTVTKPAMLYAHHEVIPSVMHDHGADTLVVCGPRRVVPHIPEGWSVNPEPLVAMGFIYQREEEQAYDSV